MVKIAQVTPSLSPGKGVEAVSYQLAKHLSSMGHGITNYTCDHNPFREDEGKVGEVITHPLLKVIETKLNGYPKMFFRTLLLSIWATIRLKELPENTIKVTHGDTFGGDVYVAHSCHWAAVHVKIRANEWKWILNPFQWVALTKEAWNLRVSNIQGLIAVSEGVGKECIKYHHVSEKKITVIPNGVDTLLFSNEKKKENRSKIVDKGKFNKDVVIGVFVAHEFSRKGLIFILDAIRLLEEKANDFHLIVIGGDNVNSYRRLTSQYNISDHVSFLGKRTAVEVSEYMSGSDIFIFPTNYEAFPLVALEALASGTPIAATSVNGIEDCLVDKKNGFLIQRNANSIRKTLEYVIDKRSCLESMSLEARKTALEYDWVSVTAKYSQYFESIAIPDKSE